MSEENKTTNSETNNNELNDFKMNFSSTDFEPILDSKFMFARKFGEIASNLFKTAFVDWEGCTISDVKGTGLMALNFFFNHAEYPEVEGKSRAITRNVDTETQDVVLRGIRRFNNVINNGDRYYLTKAAQNTFAPFLLDGINGLYGPHGNPNWSKAVSEVAEQNSQRNFNMWGQVPSQQYTVLSFIDPAKIAAKIYGEEDKEGGAKWCYQVVPVNSMPALNQFNLVSQNDPANRILRIDRVSAKELNNLAGELGFSNIGNGLNIIR